MNSTDDSSPTGPAWAIVLAAAIGCAAFGILVDLAEASKSISGKLSFYSPTGDLSGKSTLAVVVWLASWIILHFRWKQQNIQHPGRIALVAGLLILLALIATFPPFFGMFAAD